jgi:hypothetical protein
MLIEMHTHEMHAYEMHARQVRARRMHARQVHAHEVMPMKCMPMRRKLAFLDHQDIWYDLLRVGLGIDRPQWFTDLTKNEFLFEQAMTTLARYYLVEGHHQAGSYSLHVCVCAADGFESGHDERGVSGEVVESILGS